WAPLSPLTSFRGVFEVPPGHSMMVTAASTHVRPYWKPEYRRDDAPARRSEREYAAELIELLGDATRIRLRSDVPVGAYLSGGLDSTVVTGLIRRCTATPLKTFSVTFDDPEFDERAHQQQVVRYLETEHC